MEYLIDMLQFGSCYNRNWRGTGTVTGPGSRAFGRFLDCLDTEGLHLSTGMMESRTVDCYCNVSVTLHEFF